MDAIQEKLKEEWNHLDEGQEITSTEIFKNLYGYEYCYKTVHPNDFNPISLFLTKMIRNGNGYKQYTDGIKRVVYVKSTGIGSINLISKYIHVCNTRVGKVFNIPSFTQLIRLTWELKEVGLVKPFISAAIQVGLIEKLTELDFQIKCHSNADMVDLLRKVIVSSPVCLKKSSKNIEVEVVDEMPNIFVSLKKEHYNNLLDTLQKQTDKLKEQAEKIKDLQVLKARLLDEAQEMSTKLKENHRKTLVNPEKLLEEAHEQLCPELSYGYND